MHAAPPAHPSQISIDVLLQKQKCLAKISVAYFTKSFAINFYCWWVDDVYFQSPFVSPCILLGTFSIVHTSFV